MQLYNSESVLKVRKIAAAIVVIGMVMVTRTQGREFWAYSHQLAEQLSSPSIMFHATLRDGTPVTVDDYREAYWWLRDHTPEDSRVMAWWDYGYQIAGMANRTTIADGNTWNHEHIATLGRCLTSPEKDAHRNVRHLADYVLVCAGAGFSADSGLPVYKDVADTPAYREMDVTCAQRRGSKRSVAAAQRSAAARACDMTAHASAAPAPPPPPRAPRDRRRPVHAAVGEQGP